MVLGMSLAAFTQVHVVLSLIGIGAGIVASFAMFGSKTADGWTGIFLLTTILTSVTGYFFPSEKILPSHIVGALSLVALAIAVLAFYRFRLAGAWRWIYVVAAVVALYFNVFVAVVQAFAKLSFLHSIAPTQADPPFIVAQVIVLVVFIVAGTVAVRSFHPPSSASA